MKLQEHYKKFVIKVKIAQSGRMCYNKGEMKGRMAQFGRMCYNKEEMKGRMAVPVTWCEIAAQPHNL